MKQSKEGAELSALLLKKWSWRLFKNILEVALSNFTEVFKGNPVGYGNCPATVKGAKTFDQ